MGESNIEAFGAEEMAKAIIRLIEGQIAIETKLNVIDAFGKLKKEIEKLKKMAGQGRMEEIISAHRR